MQEVSFKEWLYSELVNDGYISEETDEDELTQMFLSTETDVTPDDIEDYKGQFQQACEINGWEPNYDLPDM